MPFWWLDNSDIFLAHQKLHAVMDKQLKEWDRVRFTEDEFPSPSEAYQALAAHVGLGPLLWPGKIVYTYGIPACQDRMSKELNGIHPSVLLIIIARPDGACSLYKKARELGKTVKEFKVDEPFNLTREMAIEWTSGRAKEFGREIDEQACRMLIDVVGLDPNKITHEIDKMRHLCDGKIAGWVVEQAAYGGGEADVRNFCSYLLNNKPVEAHELAQRLLGKYDPLQILAFSVDWARRILIADSCNKTLDADAKSVVQLLKKRAPLEGDEKEKARISAARRRAANWANLVELDKITERMTKSGDILPMFPNPGALYYACRDLDKSGRAEGWALDLLAGLGRLLFDAREKEDEFPRLMHDFVSRMAPGN